QAVFHAVVRADHRVQVDRRVAATHLAPVGDLAEVDLVQLAQAEAAHGVRRVGDHHQAVPGHRSEDEPAVLGAAVAGACAAGDVGRAAGHRIEARGGVERLQLDAAVAFFLPQLGHLGDHAVRGGHVAAP